MTISSFTVNPITASGYLEYLEINTDCGFAKTKCPLTKKSPLALFISVPCPVAGFATVFVVCTVKVVAPEVIFSPAVNLTGVVPDKPLVSVSVYCTYIVAGSLPVATSTLTTLAFILEVAPVNSNPIKVEVSVGNAFVVVFNLTNSKELFIVGPPGFTAAPSLNTLRPNLATSS